MCDSRQQRHVLGVEGFDSHDNGGGDIVGEISTLPQGLDGLNEGDNFVANAFTVQLVEMSLLVNRISTYQ